MIISRTPLRISFAGGGTDIKSYYSKNKYGSVISCGINLYIYVAIKQQSPITDFKYKIKWDQIENCNSIDLIKHPIIKAALKYFNIQDNLEIFKKNNNINLIFRKTNLELIKEYFDWNNTIVNIKSPSAVFNGISLRNIIINILVKLYPINTL